MPRTLPSWRSDDVQALQPFSGVKLIALDLDGTLIPYGNPKIFGQISTLRKTLNHYQVKLTLATGRTLSAVKPLVRKLLVRSAVPIILYNGALIVDNGSFKTRFHATIPIDSSNQVTQICKSYKVDILAYFYDENFGRIASSESVVGWSSYNHNLTEVNRMKVRWVGFDHPIENRPTAMLIDISRDRIHANEIQEMLALVPHISKTRSGSQFIELRSSQSDKGRALEFVAKASKFELDDIVAVGDNDNDIEMLSKAGTSVVVKGASAGAMENSHYVCHFGAAEGAVELLRVVANAKRFFQQDRQVHVLEQ